MCDGTVYYAGIVYCAILNVLASCVLFVLFLELESSIHYKSITTGFDYPLQTALSVKPLSTGIYGQRRQGATFQPRSETVFHFSWDV